MKNLTFIYSFCFLIILFSACQKGKVPDVVQGQITLYSKNDISRMDTIDKYLPNQIVSLGFGQSQTDLSAKIDYPYTCNTRYIIDGITYDTPNSANNCIAVATTTRLIKKDKLYWKAYSKIFDQFVPLVDGMLPCDEALWNFTQIDKHGHFDLEYTSDNGDVYKLEFR